MDFLSFTIGSPTLLIAAGAGALGIILIAWNIRLEVKWRALLRGTDGTNIEAALHDLQRAIKKLDDEQQTAAEHLSNIETRLPTSIRAVKTVRFNPFRGDGSGGNQSFATALLDEGGNGVVLLGLYSRDRVSIYAKPLDAFTAHVELSEEEQQAISEAKAAL